MQRGNRRTLGGVAVVVGSLVFGAAVLGALATEGALTPAMAVHATLMILAWGVLAPAGGVVARHFKITPRQNFPHEIDSPFWWNWHRGLQYGAVAVGTVAFGVIVAETGGRFDTAHGRCGLVVLVLGWLQVLSAALRGTKGGPTDKRADPGDPATWRGDHYDMSPRRLAFEAWHKRAGWAVVALGAVTILLGIELVGAPAWLLVLAGMLQGAAVLALLDGHLRARWVDTYAALWGPDPAHPGNGQSAQRLLAAADRDHADDDEAGQQHAQAGRGAR